MNIQSILQTANIIPVITIEKVEHALPLAEALIKGGLNTLEITLRTDAAIDAITAIHKAFPDCQVGAGTVIHPDQIIQIIDAGACFAVSPGITLSLVETAEQHQLPFLPGVATPSEVIAASELGCETLKFFPAHLFGGIDTLKAYASLFPNIRFCPTGGINANNAKDYLALANVISIGGSWIAPKDLIEKNDWAAITKLASKATHT